MARKGEGKGSSKKTVAPKAVAPDAPALPAASPPKVGAPVGNQNALKFTSEIAIAICDLIAESKTLDQVVEIMVAAGTPISRRAVLYWLDENADFAKLYARAHEMQGDTDADIIRDITRRVIGPLKDGEERLSAADARVAIDAYKWSAAKRNPKKYGEKVSLDTPEDGPIARAMNVTSSMIEALIKRGQSDGSE